jgi:flagellar hook-associated protein 3
MRIGTQNFYDRSLFSLQTRQAELDRAQEEVSSGKKVLAPSDDPVAANSIIRLKKELDVSDRYIKSQDAAQRFNDEGEAHLQSMTTVLYRTQELMIQSLNGSLDKESLAAIGQELQASYDEMLALTNSKNANGDYFYSGYKTDQMPFEEDAFGYAQYQGDDGQREVLVAASFLVPVTDAGSSFISNVPSSYGSFTAPAAASGAQISTGLVTDPSEFTVPTAPASTFQIQFAGVPLTWQATDVATGTLIAGPNDYQAGEDLTVQGITMKTDVNNPPIAGDQFDLTQDSASAPETNILWVIQQAIDATKLVGNTYTSETQSGSTISTSGGEVIHPEATKVADFQVTFPAPGQIQIDEVDRSTIPVTVIANTVPPQAYSPAGTSIAFNGIEMQFSGAETVGETIRIDRPDNTRRAELIGSLQVEVKDSFTNIDNIRTQIGSRLNTISNEANAIESYKLVLANNLSSLEDVDLYKAMTSLQTALTGLQASQQSFAKIQNLSLFNYL